MYLCGKFQGDRPWFIVRSDLRVELRVPEDERFEFAMVGTAFAQIYFSIPQQNARLNDFSAFRADGLGQFPEDFRTVQFDDGLDCSHTILPMIGNCPA